MRVLTVMLAMLMLISCRKEASLPQLYFSGAEKEWFIYRMGQQFRFKNSLGDSLVYKVTNVEYAENVPEYKDTSLTEVVAYSQSYYVKLESINDSIIIFFYKEWQYGANPDKMKQTIRWLSVKNQFAYLAAIENHTRFSQRTVNGITYSKVTDALSLGDQIYSFTRFEKAYYDQKAGFIEIIDVNGTSWKRQ